MFRTTLYSVIIIVLICPIVTRAYDNDTHYWFTYYLAVKAGFTPFQAEQIASADVSVDFDEDTEPVTPKLDTLMQAYRFKATFSMVRSNFHALASKKDVNEITKRSPIYWWDPQVDTDPSVIAADHKIVAKRQAEFWKAVIEKGENPGMFLHYLQDTYSHRNFESFFGHAGYRRVDHMSSDRAKALEMAMITLRYMIAFKLRMGNNALAEVRSPEMIDLSRQMTKADLDDVKRVLNLLCDVNPSAGIESNELVEKWATLKENSKTDYSTPSNYLLPALANVSLENTAPDSRRAREVVFANTPKRDSPPEIWLYDYAADGTVKPTTSYARVYKPYHPPIAPTPNFKADDEAKNTKRTKMTFETAAGNKERAYCMPFKLFSSAAVQIPFCP